jgi:hypothetical protein
MNADLNDSLDDLLDGHVTDQPKALPTDAGLTRVREMGHVETCPKCHGTGDARRRPPAHSCCQGLGRRRPSGGAEVAQRHAGAPRPPAGRLCHDVAGL